MKPPEINAFLARDVIGQEEALRFVAVAIFKHLQGERYGNLLMIGNSGTGKTTIMRAMERLYHQYKRRVFGMAHRIVGASDAEEVAQEVFVRAMRHRPEKPRAWVFAVAANLARDEARSAIRRKKHLTLLTNEPTQRHHVEPDGEDNVEHDEKMEKVRAALAELSQRDREVLLLWDAGLSYPEIAEQSGLAVGAVGTTLARARKRLIEAHDRNELERKRAHAAQS